MAVAGVIEVEGAVIASLKSGLYRVELANGHRLLAHFKGGARGKAAHFEFEIGEKVRLELSPFDLSVGRIVSNKK
jgi:translation initiation factor IF-1